MLYLIEPHGRVQWTEFPASMARKAVEQHGADLARLEWRSDTEKKMSPDLLRVALRHGLACSVGIAVEAIDVLDLHRAEELRQGYATLKQMEEEQEATSGDLMEALMPGWKEHGKRLQGELDEGSKESVAEAEARAKELLDAPEDPTLVDHWKQLGGLTH